MRALGKTSALALALLIFAVMLMGGLSVRDQLGRDAWCVADIKRTVAGIEAQRAR